jgi:molybdopterin-binding protein
VVMPAMTIEAVAMSVVSSMTNSSVAELEFWQGF